MKSPNEEIAVKGEVTLKIPVDEVRPSPTNPRKTFPAEYIQELADSIKVHGQIQPGVVRLRQPKYKIIEPDLHSTKWRVVDTATKEEKEFGQENLAVLYAGGNEAMHPYYEIVVGECRWRACKQAGMKFYTATVRELNDQDVEVMQHIENAKRRDISPIEEGASYKRLVETKVFTPEKLAEKLGKSRSHIYQRMALFKLPPVARTAVENGLIDLSVAELVAKVPGQKQQEKFLKEVMDGGEPVSFEPQPGEKWQGNKVKPESMSYRQAKVHLYSHFLVTLKKETPFALEDATLDAKAGPCTTCPKRTGCNKELHPDLKNPDVCTDPTCYQNKVKLNNERLIHEAKAKGAVPLTEEEQHRTYQYGSLAYNSPFQPANETFERDKKERNFGQVAKELGITPRCAIAPNGKVQLLFNTKDVLEEATRQGMKLKPLETHHRTAETKEEKAKREWEEKVDEACLAALVQAIFQAAQGKCDDLNADVYRILMQEIINDYDLPEAIEQENGIKATNDVKKLTGADLRALYLKTWCYSYESIDEDRVALLVKLFKIEEKAIRKEVTAKLEKERDEAAKAKPIREKIDKIVEKVKGKK